MLVMRCPVITRAMTIPTWRTSLQLCESYAETSVNIRFIMMGTVLWLGDNDGTVR